MMLKKSLLVGFGLVVCASAMAHQGVQNPAVKARMDAMVGINSSMKQVSQMAKGAAPFDQTAARAAFEKIGQLSAETPDLFRDRQDDPMSEALPAIWSNFEDFTKKSGDMEQAALRAAEQVIDLGSLKSALTEIGLTCKACHSDYRKK